MYGFVIEGVVAERMRRLTLNSKILIFGVQHLNFAETF